MVARDGTVAAHRGSIDATEAAGGPDATTFGEVLEDRSDRLGGQLGVEQHRALALGETDLAGAAPQHVAWVVGPVTGGDGPIFGVPLPVSGARMVLATEPGQVVHQSISRCDPRRRLMLPPG